jgi:hypothetical protein
MVEVETGRMVLAPPILTYNQYFVGTLPNDGWLQDFRLKGKITATLQSALTIASNDAQEDLPQLSAAWWRFSRTPDSPLRPRNEIDPCSRCPYCPLLSHAQVAVYQGTIVERVTGGGTDKTVKRRRISSGTLTRAGTSRIGTLEALRTRAGGEPKDVSHTVRDSIRVAHLNGPPRDLRSMVLSSEATAGDGSYRYHALSRKELGRGIACDTTSSACRRRSAGSRPCSSHRRRRGAAEGTGMELRSVSAAHEASGR